jgi:hypothetical protein
VKGKSSFSREEVASIASLLREIRRSPRDRQKQLRDALRARYRFYISDFTPSTRGFTEGDLAELIESGRITVN